MRQQEITLRFNLDDEIERRVYEAIQSLPQYYNEPDLSKSLIRFIDTLVNAVGECEERTAQCQAMLGSLIGQQASGKKAWN